MRDPRKPARPAVEVTKHTSWLSGLSAVRRPSAAASARTASLVMRADRQQRAGQLALAEDVEDVALVLGPIRAPGQAEGAVGPRHDPGVVAGGHRVEPHGLGPPQQAVELQVAVALDARVGRDPAAVGVDVRGDDAGLELVAEVPDVVGDAELLRHPAGVVDVAHRAAPGVGLAAPQLHGHAHHLVPVGEQAGRGHRRVDAARHGHEDLHAATPAQAGDGRRDDLEGAVDVGVGGGPAQAEAQRPAGTVGRDAHGGQDVRRLLGAAGARRGGRGAHAGLVEEEQHRLALDSRQAHVEGAGQAVGAGRAGLDQAGDGREQPVGQAVAAGAGGGRGGLAGGGRGPQRGGEADDAGDVVGAAAQLALLAAAGDERAQRRAAPDDEGADALRDRRPCAS